MELTNEFTPAVPVAEAWGVLTNIEMVAPCMPGAELREVEDDEYRGLVKGTCSGVHAGSSWIARGRMSALVKRPTGLSSRTTHLSPSLAMIVAAGP